MAKLGPNPTFREFVNHLSGLVIGFVGLSSRYGDEAGEQFQNTGRGLFTYRGHSFDISETYKGNVTGTGAHWAAFLYGWYLHKADQRGWTPGPFEDLWNDADDGDLLDDGGDA